MKREEKIERAAKKYAEWYPNAILVYRAFKDGVLYADKYPAKKQAKHCTLHGCGGDSH